MVSRRPRRRPSGCSRGSVSARGDASALPPGAATAPVWSRADRRGTAPAVPGGSACGRSSLATLRAVQTAVKRQPSGDLPARKEEDRGVRPLFVLLTLLLAAGCGEDDGPRRAPGTPPPDHAA